METMGLGVTVGQVIDRLAALEVVDAPEAVSRLRYGTPDDDLGYFGHDTATAVVELLTAIGVAVSVHCSDLEVGSAYEGLARDVTACTGGAVAVTDVELDYRDGRDGLLRFRRNGEPCEWEVDHEDLEYCDLSTITERFGEFDPPDARRWSLVTNREIHDRYFILAEPEALAAIAREYGLDLLGYD
ncbi:hypothetical protein GCM10023223_16730 [Stackebrandtia albiflava]